MNYKQPRSSKRTAKRKFGILLVWELDRPSRSLKDLINTLDELGHLGTNIISYDNNLDTTTPTGKLVFQIIGAVADFEKDIIRERVVAGLENAQQKCKKLGQPEILDGPLKKAKDLRSQGMSFRKIEKQLGVGEETIRKQFNSLKTDESIGSLPEGEISDSIQK